MFGKRLQTLRENEGKTKKAVAEKIGVHESTYGKYELGHREPDTKTLQKLADYFGVTIDYLLCRTRSPGTTPSANKAAGRSPAAEFEKYIDGPMKEPPDDFAVLARKAGQIPEEDRKLLYNLIDSTIDTVINKLKEEGKL